MTNPFGLTSPCANIARHFGLPQDFVDALMEVKLVHRKVRSSVAMHIPNYLRESNIDAADADAAMVALDLVIDDMIAQAGGPPAPTPPAA